MMVKFMTMMTMFTHKSDVKECCITHPPFAHQKKTAFVVIVTSFCALKHFDLILLLLSNVQKLVRVLLLLLEMQTLQD